MAAAVLAVVQIAPWISGYKVVVWSWTLALLVAVILLPRVWTAGRWLAGGNAVALGRSGNAARPVIVGAGVLLVFWMVMETRLHVMHGGNYSGFLIINPELVRRESVDQHARRYPPESQAAREGGYDGQFMYYLHIRSVDARVSRSTRAVPTGRQRRALQDGRIGFSALTRLIAGERWQWYPATMMWLILLSLGASALVLAAMAQDAGITPIAGALVLVVPGFWRSMQAALPEPLAAAMLLAGLLAVFKGRWLLAAGLFAVSLLVRETGAILVTSVAGALAFSGRRREAATLWLLAIAPALLWRIYVGWTIYPDSAFKAFSTARPSSAGR